MNAVLVQDWILREMAAYSLVDRVGQSYLFYGDKTDFLISVQAIPVRKNVRLREPKPDFGEDGRG